MLEEIKVEEVIREKNINFSKPTVYENREYPLEKLTPDEFEILTYYLYESNENKKEKYNYDRAIYIEGGSDKGRDLVLKKDGKITGIIQCKHSKKGTNVGKEKIAEELLKILLYMIIYPKEITSKKINYLLVVSSGFSKSGENYIENMKKYFDENNNDLKEETENIIKKYKTFEEFFKNENINDIITKIIKKFKRINFGYEDKNDIFLELNSEKKGIRGTFFSVKIVEVTPPEFPSYKKETKDEILKKKKEEYIEEKFCKELERINAKDRHIEKAIVDFYKKQCITLDLYSRGIIKLEKILENFEEKLIEFEESERELFIVKNTKEKNLGEKSLEYYIQFLYNIERQKIDDRILGEISLGFKRGTIQELVNESKIEKWYLEDEK